MHVRAGVATSVGLVRQTNEDSYLVRRGLYVICDGMGGARAGEIASEMACRGLAEIDPPTTDAAGLLARVREVNQIIAERSVQDSRLFGMGTTLTAALAADNALALVHVGDSRAYLLHEGVLRQLTQDHSWVGEMIRRGELTPAEAAVHPHRSVITKVLGTETEVEPDLLEVAVSPGDRLLLCSDGLSNMVRDPALADLLGAEADPQTVAESLVRAALAAGGEDNVTVIVAEVEGEPAGGADDQAGAAGPAGGAADEIVLGPSDRGAASGDHGASAALRNVRAAARGKLAGWSPMAGQRSAEPAAERPLADGALARGPLEDLPPVTVGAGAQLGAGASGRNRSRRRRWIVVALVVVVVLAVALGGFAVFNSAVYYVGTYDGKVALYNGLPGSFLGVELSSIIEQGTATYDSLPSYVQERIDTHELTSKEEGQNYLRSLNAWQ